MRISNIRVINRDGPAGPIDEGGLGPRCVPFGLTIRTVACLGPQATHTACTALAQRITLVPHQPRPPLSKKKVRLNSARLLSCWWLSSSSNALHRPSDRRTAFAPGCWLPSGREATNPWQLLPLCLVVAEASVSKQSAILMALSSTITSSSSSTRQKLLRRRWTPQRWLVLGWGAVAVAVAALLGSRSSRRGTAVVAVAAFELHRPTAPHHHRGGGGGITGGGGGGGAGGLSTPGEGLLGGGGGSISNALSAAVVMSSDNGGGGDFRRMAPPTSSGPLSAVVGSGTAAELAVSPPPSASAPEMTTGGDSPLLASSAATAAPWLIPPSSTLSLSPAATEASSSLLDWLQTTGGPVVSAALLVTGNTVGAGCLVLPQLAAGPGLAASTGIFLGAYVLNLLSGWTIAHVAVQQHQRSQVEAAAAAAAAVSLNAMKEVKSPTTFKELAHANVHPLAGTAVSLLSIFVNACVLIFAIGQVGHWPHTLSLFPSNVLPTDPVWMSLAFATVVGSLVATQSGSTLSHVASGCVAVMGAAFAGLLLPVMAAASTTSSHHDVWAPFAVPGTDPDTIGALAKAAPVILTSLVYQNIVPTVTRLLQYRMGPTSVALAVGSFVPLAMYEAWCYAAGPATQSIDTHSTLLQVFTVATLCGSTIGTTLSLSEEVQCLLIAPLLKFLGQAERHSTVVESNDSRGAAAASIDTAAAAAAATPTTHHNQSRWMGVAASLAVPIAASAWAAAQGQGEHPIDLSSALQWAGSLGSPLLYGVLPALMAYRLNQNDKDASPLTSWPCIGLLGGCSVAFASQELLHRVSEVTTALG